MEQESIQRLNNIENIYGYGGADVIDLTALEYSPKGQFINVDGVYLRNVVARVRSVVVSEYSSNYKPLYCQYNSRNSS
jgi:hypothetical protein